MSDTHDDDAKKSRGGDPSRVDLTDIEAIAKEMVKRSPPAADIELRESASDEESRETNLRQSNVGGAITSEDWRWIVNDTIPLQTQALDAVQRWFLVRFEARRRARTMQVLLGETSRGKTFAAVWLIARLGGVYVTAERMRRLMDSHQQRQQQEFERLAATKVLVVDDAGGELDGPSAAATMFEIVNHRQGLANGWTVITANLSPQAFEARYGVRTVRRIEHQGEIVEVGGPDLRRKGRRKEDGPHE